MATLAAALLAGSWHGVRTGALSLALTAGGYYVLAALIFAIAWLATRRFKRGARWLTIAFAAIVSVLPASALLTLAAMGPPPAPWRSIVGVVIVTTAPVVLGRLVFAALLEGRTEKGRALWIGAGVVCLAVFAPFVIAALAWRVPQEELTRAELGYRMWDAGSPSECPLIAEALRETSQDILAAGAPLVGVKTTGGPCDWKALGFSMRRTALSALREANESGREQGAYVMASRPLYSRVRYRAVVDVQLAGQTGHECFFRRGLAGWRLQTCEPYLFIHDRPPPRQ